MGAVGGRDEKFKKYSTGEKERTKLANKMIICHLQDPWQDRDLLLLLAMLVPSAQRLALRTAYTNQYP